MLVSAGGLFPSVIIKIFSYLICFFILRRRLSVFLGVIRGLRPLIVCGNPKFFTLSNLLFSFLKLKKTRLLRSFALRKREEKEPRKRERSYLHYILQLLQ